jgi:gamma-glutamyltranspeptidase/glutathione hydrolase
MSFRFRRAAVAAEHPVASAVGTQVLRAGGNAVDAAVAVAFALGVVQPDSSGIGGGGFLLYHRAADGAAFALDFRETAPAAAHRSMYVEAPPGASEHGGLAVAVPGQVAGLAEAHRVHGRLAWADVVEPARALAAEPVAVTPKMHKLLTEQKLLLERYAELCTTLYRSSGDPLSVGETYRFAGHQIALRTIRDDPQAFYRGPFAQDVGDAVRAAGGLLTHQDLAAYRPQWRPVLAGRYRRWSVLAMPPPSSGGAVSLVILGLLDRLPGWPDADAAAYVHRLVEAMKHGFADRSTSFGDPDFADVPVAALLAPERLDGLAREIRGDRASVVRRDTSPAPVDAGTSHVSIVDEDGNAVAATFTVNTEFGSKVMASGFPLNNQMDNFTSAPGQPNSYGLIQSEANAIAPGKRPLSSMCPLIFLEDGKVALVAGASGGPRIISGTLQAVLQALDRERSCDDAVDAPRLHHQWKPDRVYLEDAYAPAVREALVARGHAVARETETSSVQLVRAVAGGLDAASDPRKGGKPDGY